MKRIEIYKKYKGYGYMVYATEMGHRCGYVRIPSKHYLYKKSYSEQLNIKFDALKNESIGKRNPITLFCSTRLKKEDNISMDLLFDVHGGITFADFGKNLMANKPGWWIGFDCAHCDDAKDIEIMDKESFEIQKGLISMGYGTVRTKDYVEQECKNLIEQIIKYFPKEVKREIQ